MDIVDVLGVGFGPGNLALAIACEELFPEAEIRFLESRAGPTWQPDMLFGRSNIQNHPIRDLVTLRNPRSRYSFVNYLFEQGRLVEHLNLGLDFPLRKEYAQYIEWAAGFFSHLVDYSQHVTEIRLVPDGAGQRPCYLVRTAAGRRYYARVLVIGTGRTPYIPPLFKDLPREQVFHATQYLSRTRALAAQQPLRAVAVVGGSQSAIEITLDLARCYPNCRIVNYVRDFGYRLKDTSPFSEECYFPGFVDYYYQASPSSKEALNAYLRHTNYSSADKDVIDDLYLLLYEQKLDRCDRVQVKTNTVIETAECCSGTVRLQVRERHTGAVEECVFDALVLATGFRDLGNGPRQESHPPLLKPLCSHLAYDVSGALRIEADYRVALEPADALPPIYLNGLCESSHGMGDAGSFSLLSIRAAVICRSIQRSLLLQQHGGCDG